MGFFLPILRQFMRLAKPISPVEAFPVVLLTAILGLAYLLYWPGLQGGFLFDDFPNLQDLGVYGGVVDWETLKAYLLNGWSGPTGRPISLVSFLIDDNGWPAPPAGFKRTNLLIHLLCGVLLTWVTLRYLRLLGWEESKAQWVALLSSGCWLLHPYLVSTTLYVVQRMAQLSFLFMLVGLALYLKGRGMLGRSARAAYAWMTTGVVAGTILAVLSKENGALLPLLILVVEFCLPQERAPGKAWRAIFLWLPAFAVLAYLASLIDFSPNPWPERPFNQKERLLSEARIVWEYLYSLYVPQIEGRGLFQDGYPISRSLLEPRTTLPAVAGIVLLTIMGFRLRRRTPWTSLAILFFLAGHLIESTVVGLEPYFEHRNYHAAAFLFLPVAQGVRGLYERFGARLAVVAGFLILAFLSAMTGLRTNLWRDTDMLELYWAQATPDSPRAQNTIANFLVRHGEPEKSIRHLEAAIERLPNSTLLTLGLLIQKAGTRTATWEDFVAARDRLAKQPFDAQAVTGLRTLVGNTVTRKNPPFYIDGCLLVIDGLEQNPRYGDLALFRRLLPYLRGQLHLSAGRLDLAYREYETAAKAYGDVETALMMVAELASAKQYALALDLLGVAQAILARQGDRSLRRSRLSYEKDIEILRRQLLDDLSKGKMVTSRNDRAVPPAPIFGLG